MKKSLGFTLVELLAVIVIMGIIVTIGVISVSSSINSSKKQVCKQQVESIIKATKNWAIEHTNELPDSGYVDVSLGDLYELGYLSEEPINPVTGSSMGGEVRIECSGINCNSYNYIYNGNCG